MMMTDLPHDIILERNAIQKFLEDTPLKKLKTWSNIIDDDDFHDEVCRKAFASIRVCLNRGTNPDPSSLFATGYITREELQVISMSNTSASQMKQHIGLLKEYAIRRAILKATEEIQGRMISTSNPREEALQFIDKISIISKSKSTGDLLDTRKIVKDTLQMLKDGTSSNSKLRVFFHAPFIDNYVLAFRKEVVVVAGNSGMGKTSLGLTCVLPQILAGEHVIYFCNESDNTKLMAKLWSQYIGCSFTDMLLHMDKLNPDEIRKLKEISDLVTKHSNNFHLYGAGTYEHSVSGITVKAQEIHEQYGPLDMIYVDYLQDMSPPSFYAGKEVESVAYNIQGIKTLIQSLNCACVVFAQINRSAKENPRPVMENLKGSSKIENVASIVLFIHRDKQEGATNKILPTLMYSDKTRDQKQVWTTIGFNGKCTRFEKYNKPIEHQYGVKDQPPKQPYVQPQQRGK